MAIGDCQVQVAKDKKFKKSVKNYFSWSKNTKFHEDGESNAYTQISKLKKGTYYVRVRNFGIASPNGKYCVDGRSKWSKPVKIKVK